MAPSAHGEAVVAQSRDLLTASVHGCISEHFWTDKSTIEQAVNTAMDKSASQYSAAFGALEQHMHDVRFVLLLLTDARDHYEQTIATEAIFSVLSGWFAARESGSTTA